MKFQYTLLFLAAVCWSCSGTQSAESHDHTGHEHNHAHHDHAHNHDHSHEHNHAHSGHNHDAEEEEHASDIITMEPEQAQALGVASHAVNSGQFQSILRVSAEVLPSVTSQSSLIAPASGRLNFKHGIGIGSQMVKGAQVASINTEGLVGGDTAAQLYAAYQSARQEVDRLTPLHADGIVSTREYNQAVAALNQAKAAYSGVQSGGTVTAPETGTIVSLDLLEGSYVSAGQVIGSIASNSQSVIRGFIPASAAATSQIFQDFNFKPGGSAEVFTAAELKATRNAGMAAVVQSGYVPVYFTVSSDRVMPGMMGELFLKGAVREDVLTVPQQAIDEDQGQLFVYVQLDEDCYRKTPVRIGQSDGIQAEVLSGLKAGDRVVDEGKTFVRMAQNAGAVPEGHSHSH